MFVPSVLLLWCSSSVPLISLVSSVPIDSDDDPVVYVTHEPLNALPALHSNLSKPTLGIVYYITTPAAPIMDAVDGGGLSMTVVTLTALLVVVSCLWVITLAILIFVLRQNSQLLHHCRNNKEEQQTNDNNSMQEEGPAPPPRPVLPPHKKMSEEMRDANHTDGDSQHQWRQYVDDQQNPQGKYVDDQNPQGQYAHYQYPQEQNRDDQYQQEQYRDGQYQEEQYGDGQYQQEQYGDGQYHWDQYGNCLYPQGQDGQNQNHWRQYEGNPYVESPWTGTLPSPHGNDTTQNNNPESTAKAPGEEMYITAEVVIPILAEEMRMNNTLKGRVNYTDPGSSHGLRKASAPATLGSPAPPGHQVMEGPAGTDVDDTGCHRPVRQQQSGGQSNYDEDDYIEIIS